MEVGWRASTIDADLWSDSESVFRDVQDIKERLNINVELVRPEDFVPKLADSDKRHILIEIIGTVSFYHYDPYSQVFSKVVRGFDRDLQDATHFVSSGMVEPATLEALIHAVPVEAYSRYPRLSPRGVREAVDHFVSGIS